MEKRRILFVCLGNICRSPLAEGILRYLAAERGLSELVKTASAGTGGWHRGEPPDPRSIAVAGRHGVDISAQRARQVTLEDFENFDMIFAMDRANLRDIVRLAPHDSSADIHLFLDFVDELARDVPDPYYGEAAAFQDVFEMIERGCRILLDTLYPESAGQPQRLA